VKFLALSALVLLAPGVRLEKDGVRIGDALVQGEVLELRGTILASGSSIEALAFGLEVEVAAGRTLTLDPGLRLTRTDGGCRLAGHDRREIRFASEGATFLASGPVEVVVTPEGWRVGDRALAGGALRAGLGQDEESNLDRMLKDKERMRAAAGVPRLSTRTSRRYRGNPLTSGNAAESVSVRQIFQVSPSGAP
jgi:hypothetical protein